MRVMVAIPMSKVEITKSVDGGFEDVLLGKESKKEENPIAIATAEIPQEPKKKKDYTLVFMLAILATFAIVIYSTNKITK